MRILNNRIASNSDSTLGVLSIDDKLRGFVIEDEFREEKVSGETRIDAGMYEVERRMALTPLTGKYRQLFDWFSFHLEIKNVPDFTDVYMHIGNFEHNTDACQLVNRKAKIYEGNYAGEDSTSFFKEIYLEIIEELEKGNKVYYQIVNKD